jgi:adenine-specific DNA-methyltransferase
LSGNAEFLNDSSFRLIACPFPNTDGDIPLGLYELPRRSGEAHLYRLHHPLAEAAIAQAKGRELPPAEMQFNYRDYGGMVSALEPFLGQSGWLTLSLFSVESLDQAEDHLIFSAVTDAGQTVDEAAASRLLTLPGTVGQCVPADPNNGATLESLTHQRYADIQRIISERNAGFFEAEAEKLEGWADDLKLGLEREIKEFDRQIREARRTATIALTLEDKLAGQKQIKALESQRNEKRRSLFDAQDKVDQQRGELIANIEGKLTQNAALSPLFKIRWRLT